MAYLKLSIYCDFEILRLVEIVQKQNVLSLPRTHWWRVVRPYLLTICYGHINTISSAQHLEDYSKRVWEIATHDKIATVI